MYLVTEPSQEEWQVPLCKTGGSQGAWGWQVSMSPRPVPPSAREHALQGAKAPAQERVGMMGKIPGFSFLVSRLEFLLATKRFLRLGS